MVLSCLLQLSFNSWRATTHCGSQDRRIQKLKHILHSRGRGFYIRPHEGNPFLSSKKIPKQLHTSPRHCQRLPTHTDRQPTEHPLASSVWVLVRNRNLHISFPRCFHVTCVSRLLTESQKDSARVWGSAHLLACAGKLQCHLHARAHKWEVKCSFEKSDRVPSHQEAALCENLKRHRGGSWPKTRKKILKWLKSETWNEKNRRKVGRSVHESRWLTGWSHFQQI